MPDRHSVIVVGNFDGLHRGHCKLFAMARSLADAQDADVIAVTFTRHPLEVLRPAEAPPTLLHREQRAAALTEAGVDKIDWLEPSPDVLQLSPESFIHKLVAEYRPAAIVEGVNFRFGKGRSGGADELKRIGEKLNIDVRIVDLVTVALRDKTLVQVSSSLVRWLLAHGRVGDVTLCLGRPWVLRGSVVEGERRGKSLGFPTANLDTRPQMLPADGVYGGTVELDGKRYLAAVSVGTKPTFETPPQLRGGGLDRVCEVHLLDYDGDLYGRTVETAMHRWVRDQMKFSGPDELVRQMRDDVALLRQLEEHDALDPAALAMSH